MRTVVMTVRRRTDRMLLLATAGFVGGLAVVAGAISFAHMRELALDHGQLGWKSYAFPISVDGLEIVASLFLVAQRRAGRPTGWVPWAALIVGTAASLAANIAVGGADPVGKALAGWPALSMLAAIKLLFSMLDHGQPDHRGDDQRTVPDVQRTSSTVPDVLRPVPRTGRDEPGPSSIVSGQGTAGPRPVDISAVAHLVPAARAARAALSRDGRSLSRDNLADAMRDDGHGVSNARASLLVRILKAEARSTIVPNPPGADVIDGSVAAPTAGPSTPPLSPTGRRFARTDTGSGQTMT
ncbi:DUF2637 domain-containing protein [Virgisporangium ochraceum]|uniref:DUF2637 domain-containing protein n=1 Tax=Virgisporangium ochraceum TaxID=65505 RepID=UPI001EF1E960|nr:DUF2637 domain-containing protein [Virgisporangium ochraceum]